ncbi:THO complex subunit 7 [Mortierella polycephala]|uniref:THO complex subunit 7 n=1 Tax=Mortierella polycephala TaxID=41804 RepID=A0A9P6PMA2_9FUNG|nr:THO complex subunit 7 [Mortierella polycephala]
MDQEEAVIRTRLSINERPLRRLSNRFLKWTGSLTTATDEDIDDGLQTLLLEVSHFELTLSKSKLVADMAERERQHYDQEQQEINESIVKSQGELEDLARELEEAKQERTNKIEYDQLAAEVSKFPSRESSQASIADLKAEILELEKEAVQQSMMMELRKKQFFTALLCLQSIQESIVEDQQEEERRLYLKSAQQDDDMLGDEEEEEGFEDSTDNVTVTISSPSRGLASGMERVISLDRQSPTLEKSAVLASPSPNSYAPGSGGTTTQNTGEGDVFVIDLQSRGSYDSAAQTPAGTPGRAQHPTPTPPSRSLTSTPNPSDSAMDIA